MLCLGLGQGPKTPAVFPSPLQNKILYEAPIISTINTFNYCVLS